MISAHPAADLFPMHDSDTFEALVLDMAEHGQREDIVLYEGQCLDGRNRLMACERLGIEPSTWVYPGADPVAYVLSANLHRRHLTTSQKVVAAVKALPLLEAESGCAVETIAKRMGTSVRSVQRGQRIADKAPELFELMADGVIETAAAERALRLDEDKRGAFVDRVLGGAPAGLALRELAPGGGDEPIAKDGRVGTALRGMALAYEQCDGGDLINYVNNVGPWLSHVVAMHEAVCQGDMKAARAAARAAEGAE